jgi:hypothetical protein
MRLTTGSSEFGTLLISSEKFRSAACALALFRFCAQRSCMMRLILARKAARRSALDIFIDNTVAECVAAVNEKI